MERGKPTGEQEEGRGPDLRVDEGQGGGDHTLAKTIQLASRIKVKELNIKELRFFQLQENKMAN